MVENPGSLAQVVKAEMVVEDEERGYLVRVSRRGPQEVTDRKDRQLSRLR